MSSSCGFKGIAILDTQSFEELLNARELWLKEKDNSFPVPMYLFSRGNAYYDDHFCVKQNAFSKIDHDLKSIHFCTSMRQEHEKTFIRELNQIATSILMLGITEFDPSDLESVYVKNAQAIADHFSDDCEKISLDIDINEDGIFRLNRDWMQPSYGYGFAYDEEPKFKRTHDQNWEKLNNYY